MTDQQTMDRINKVFKEIIQNDPVLRNRFMTVQPSYRYFYHKGCKDQYFWTTEAVKHNGKMRYASGIYKYIKSRNAFKLMNERYHAKRKDAKSRALELYHSTNTI